MPPTFAEYKEKTIVPFQIIGQLSLRPIFHYRFRRKPKTSNLKALQYVQTQKKFHDCHGVQFMKRSAHKPYPQDSIIIHLLRHIVHVMIHYDRRIVIMMQELSC